MVAIIIFNDNIWFKSVFKDMCAALGIIYWYLTRGNHKDVSIEKYHRFLNKTRAIAGQDRCMHDVFLHNAKTSQYDCNSAPIDGTDILGRVAAVGRELRFLLDTERPQTPITLNQGNCGMYEYIRHVSNNSQFATAILHILIKERRTAHRERWNQNWSDPEFKVGDANKDHVQVQ